MPEGNIKQTLQDVDSLLDQRECKAEWCAKIKGMHPRQKQSHCEANKAPVLESLTCLIKLKYFHCSQLRLLSFFFTLTFPSITLPLVKWQQSSHQYFSSLFLHQAEVKLSIF